jgi:hypothetical protein
MDEKAFQYTLDNLWRARRILDLAMIDLPKEIKNTKKTKSDLLGSCIIFLHATLEEFLRGVAIRNWIKLDSEDLKKNLRKYPRLNSRNIKLNLIEAIDKREVSVESIIQQEIEDFVYKDMNFSSIEDVEEFLTLSKVSLRKEPPEIKVEEGDISNIKSLIRKRHKVAHNADCSGLNVELVAVWAKSLQSYIFNLSHSLGLEIQYRENIKQVQFIESALVFPQNSNQSEF